MWIRSQNEKALINTNNFKVVERSGSSMFKYPYCIETRTENGFIYLGEYSTMKKALKVLDEIEDTLYCLNGFYQMPEDNEVEE